MYLISTSICLYFYIYITQEIGSVIGQKFSGDFFFNGCVIQYSAVKFLTEKKIIARDE